MADKSSENIHKRESDIHFIKEEARIEEDPAAGLKSYAVRIALNPN
jgi:hypothetical protein